MFQWINSILSFKKTFQPSNNIPCKTCGLIYHDMSSAALCSDWDKIIGIERHGSLLNNKKC